MTLASRLDRIAAALGADGDPDSVVMYLAADDVWRTAAGEVIDPALIDPAVQVFAYCEVAAGRPPALPPMEPI